MYFREASALDLFTDSVRCMGDATLCAVLEFDRRLDPLALRDATHACLLAHPVLHSRLVRRNGAAFWEQIEPVSAPPVTVEECPGHYYPYVISPIDPYGALQFRVRVLRRPAGDVIVINLSHAAADGFGLVSLASQLLTEYAEPASIPPATGGIPPRDTLWTRGLVQENRPAPGAVNVENPMWRDPFGTSRQPSSYHKDTVSPAEVRAIHAHVKSLGGNMNDAVMASYFLALCDLTGQTAPMDLFFPVNLRQHLKDGSRVMCNQSTNVCFRLARPHAEGMEEILPRVIDETRRLKRGGIGISEQVGMDLACDPAGTWVHEEVARMAALQREGMADIFISNPGVIALPGIDGLTDAYLCYPGGYMPTTCFVISTFRGKMTITMGYQNSQKARTGTHKAVQLFRYYLMSVVEGGGRSGHGDFQVRFL